jgi:hypothetical protein
MCIKCPSTTWSRGTRQGTILVVKKSFNYSF